ncbi:hypothetical protein A3C98_02720 [Candidatus Roizmanbacteria bacterium RIFCSPHIGHO2_02_FULL_37_15]|nr:MAG: hypothetical protein A3C98_02720 [Candidatus Roizmanbacteria bacterium RIFCSPHIGHO2_02_FULL_37_15]OGK33957.1 MAG: hypothetical protein A3F57_06055 [Candidatus Roizmanbacteria bacterium RIFCSPHIGHO2_12_FULL_36_11]
MGKIRTRILGYEDIEIKQKEEQKRRADEKKHAKHKIRAQGLKGGERMVQIEVGEDAVSKMEKAKKILTEDSGKEIPTGKEAGKKIKKIKKHVRGKNYLQAKKEIEKNKTSNLSTSLKKSLKLLTLSEAIKLLKKIHFAKFDESVEFHLNVDKEGLKGEIDLPHLTGKTFRVKIVDDKTLLDIEKGDLKFDILITHPQYMPKLAKYAKVLGPKGLMPNPKAGTISDKPEEVAKKFSKGAIRWKTEAKAPLIHQTIGKISFEEKALLANAEALLESVGKSHIRKAFIKTTMSPSIGLLMDK